MDQKKLNEAIDTLQSFLKKPIEEIRATVTDFDKANALFEVILSKFLPIYSDVAFKGKNFNIEVNYHHKRQQVAYDVRLKYRFDIENKDKIIFDD